MRLYKCLNQTLDLDHVLAVSDYSNEHLGFSVTLALRDMPLGFDYRLFPREDLQSKEKLIAARCALLNAWSAPTAGEGP